MITTYQTYFMLLGAIRYLESKNSNHPDLKQLRINLKKIAEMYLKEASNE